MDKHHIRVANSGDMWAAIEAAIKAGVPELHIGHERCGGCGGEIEQEVKGIGYSGGGFSREGPTTRVYWHLCGDCWDTLHKAGVIRDLGGN